MTGAKYLKYLNPLTLFDTKRTRDIFHVNPTIIPERVEASEIRVKVYDYSATEFVEKQLSDIKDCFAYLDNEQTTWINVDGIRKADVEAVCHHFGIHYLIVEDIMSVSQRPKMDEM